MSDKPKIDKGIPIPTKAGGGVPSKYPFRAMEVGDSFLAEAPEGMSRRQLRIAVTSAAAYQQTTYGTKFSVRTVSDGIRCWRVK